MSSFLKMLCDVSDFLLSDHVIIWLHHCPSERAQMERNVLNIVAKSIVTGKLKVEVPEVVTAFYTIDWTEEWNMEYNVNSTWIDLVNDGTFNGGFFVHDFDGMGFTIHQKLRHLRYALIHRHLELEKVEEYIPWIDGQHEVDVWKQRFVDLKRIRSTL